MKKRELSNILGSGGQVDTIGFDPIEEGALPSSPAIKRGLNKSVDNASKLDSYSSETLSSCFGETPTPVQGL